MRVRGNGVMICVHKHTAPRSIWQQFLHFRLFQIMSSCHSEVPEMTKNSVKLLLLLMLAQVQFSATVAAKGSYNDNICNTSNVGTNTL